MHPDFFLLLLAWLEQAQQDYTQKFASANTYCPAPAHAFEDGSHTDAASLLCRAPAARACATTQVFLLTRS